MFEISRERVFSASHQLRGYKGACERLHGHNWRVRVHLRAFELDNLGMVMDFHEIDAIMGEAISPYDHQHLNEVEPFTKINPSSENLAKVLFARIQKQVKDPRIEVCFCDVWENDRSRARFIP